MKKKAKLDLVYIQKGIIVDPSDLGGVVLNIDYDRDNSYYDEGNSGVIALVNSKIIGAFGFSFYRRSAMLSAGGTWVSKKYRRKGIGSKLWTFAIKKMKPKKIDVMVASNQGMTLVNSMKEDFPKIKFNVDDVSWSGTQYKDLRKKKKKSSKKSKSLV